MFGSSCSDCLIRCALLDETPQLGNPYLAATFRVGGNGAADDPGYQLSKGLVVGTAQAKGKAAGKAKGKARGADGGGSGASKAGALIWDPSHREPGAPFFTVAPVRLEVRPTEARWAVGTSGFLTLPASARDYGRITEIWVVADLGESPRPQRIVQWNSLDLTFFDAGGHWEALRSPCLPAAQNMQEARRSVVRRKLQGKATPQRVQVAVFRLGGEDAVQAHITGQVTMRANQVFGARDALKPDDLRGAVYVFTDTRPAPKQAWIDAAFSD